MGSQACQPFVEGERFALVDVLLKAAHELFDFGFCGELIVLLDLAEREFGLMYHSSDKNQSLFLLSKNKIIRTLCQVGLPPIC
jgi:hypothetical protein